MYLLKKKFLICRWYEKDIWGIITTKHKTVNFGRVTAWPNVAFVPHLNKKWLFEDFTKKFPLKGFWFLKFSYEIVWKIKKRWKKKMKNWMWLFFLAKLLWLFYGDFTKRKFTTYCADCLSWKYNSFFFFLKMFELWISMFLYRIGFANSLASANEWIHWGLVYINEKPVINNWLPIHLHDHISFNIKIWHIIIENIVELLYYAKFAARRRRCWAKSRKRASMLGVPWAHFISVPNYVYFNTKTISLYWWKPISISRLKYYFSVSLHSMMKHITM